MTEPPISRLTVEEKEQFDEAIRKITQDHPIRDLLTCAIAPDNKAEIRVSRWPASVAEFDVLIRALTAVRGAFLKDPSRRKHK